VGNGALILDFTPLPPYPETCSRFGIWPGKKQKVSRKDVTTYTTDSHFLYRFGRFHGFQGQAAGVDRGKLTGKVPDWPQDGRKY